MPLIIVSGLTFTMEHRVKLPSMIEAIENAGTVSRAKRSLGYRRVRQALQIGAVVFHDQSIHLTEVGYLLKRALTRQEISEALSLKYILMDRERL